MPAFVTSLYAVREGYLETLYTEFQKLLGLLQSNDVLFVWTDRDLPFPVPSQVHVLKRPLNSFAAYSSVHNNGALTLPAMRSASKDTQDFMALMNTKVEMVWHTIPFVPQETTHIAWIDAGICKIFKDWGRVQTAWKGLAAILWPARKVAIPGCWSQIASSSKDSVCWRFCGGFFVVPVNLLQLFYNESQRVLQDWLSAGRIAWEVNIWADMEHQFAELFAWWSADHNERMLEPPSAFNI
jgi:hypothetical protein